MVLFFLREMASDTELDPPGIFAIRFAEKTAVRHDHGVTPIVADIAEPFGHFFHHEERAGRQRAVFGDDETVFSDIGPDRQGARFLILQVRHSLRVYEIADKATAVRCGTVGGCVGPLSALIVFRRRVTGYGVS
jgi:hypothetical protein